MDISKILLIILLVILAFIIGSFIIHHVLKQIRKIFGRERYYDDEYYGGDDESSDEDDDIYDYENDPAIIELKRDHPPGPARRTPEYLRDMKHARKALRLRVRGRPYREPDTSNRAPPKTREQVEAERQERLRQEKEAAEQLERDRKQAALDVINAPFIALGREIPRIPSDPVPINMASIQTQIDSMQSQIAQDIRETALDKAEEEADLVEQQKDLAARAFQANKPYVKLRETRKRLRDERARQRINNKNTLAELQRQASLASANRSLADLFESRIPGNEPETGPGTGPGTGPATASTADNIVRAFRRRFTEISNAGLLPGLLSLTDAEKLRRLEILRRDIQGHPEYQALELVPAMPNLIREIDELITALRTQPEPEESEEESEEPEGVPPDPPKPQLDVIEGYRYNVTRIQTAFNALSDRFATLGLIVPNIVNITQQVDNAALITGLLVTNYTTSDYDTITRMVNIALEAVINNEFKEVVRQFVDKTIADATAAAGIDTTALTTARDAVNNTNADINNIAAYADNIATVNEEITRIYGLINPANPLSALSANAMQVVNAINAVYVVNSFDGVRVVAEKLHSINTGDSSAAIAAVRLAADAVAAVALPYPADNNTIERSREIATNANNAVQHTLAIMNSLDPLIIGNPVVDPARLNAAAVANSVNGIEGLTAGEMTLRMETIHLSIRTFIDSIAAVFKLTLLSHVDNIVRLLGESAPTVDVATGHEVMENITDFNTTFKPNIERPSPTTVLNSYDQTQTDLVTGFAELIRDVATAAIAKANAMNDELPVLKTEATNLIDRINSAAAAADISLPLCLRVITAITGWAKEINLLDGQAKVMVAVRRANEALDRAQTAAAANPAVQVHADNALRQRDIAIQYNVATLRLEPNDVAEINANVAAAETAALAAEQAALAAGGPAPAGGPEPPHPLIAQAITAARDAQEAARTAALAANAIIPTVIAPPVTDANILQVERLAQVARDRARDAITAADAVINVIGLTTDPVIRDNINTADADARNAAQAANDAAQAAEDAAAAARAAARIPPRSPPRSPPGSPPGSPPRSPHPIRELDDDDEEKYTSILKYSNKIGRFDLGNIGNKIIGRCASSAVSENQKEKIMKMLVDKIPSDYKSMEQKYTKKKSTTQKSPKMDVEKINEYADSKGVEKIETLSKKVHDSRVNSNKYSKAALRAIAAGLILTDEEILTIKV